MSGVKGLRSGLQFVAIAIITISTILLFSGGKAPAQSVRFRDLQGHWAQPCIQDLAERRVINGYPDGTVRPNGLVTRAEFATMVDAAFSPDPRRSAIQFADVPSNHWAAKAIRSAFQSDFMSGYPGNRFVPNQNIPRAQVLVAIASGLQVAPQAVAENELETWFDDASLIPEYARPGVTAALENKLIVNYPNVRRLDPNRPATRAEVATAICQAYSAETQVSLVSAQYVASVDGTGGTVGSNPNNPNPGTGVPVQPSTPIIRPNPRPNLPSEEIRGVWLTNVDSDVLFSTERLKSAIAELGEMNFNTLYPTVWNWGYTLYPSRVAEQVFGWRVDPEPGLQDRDMLAEAVAEGHRHNMKVLPWFEFGFMAPSYSDLAKKHPEWLTQRFDGSQIYMEGEHPRVWLNPFHPEVQQFIINMVTEIVANYDIDGIQFDDHFGLPYEFGYDPYTVKLYKREHNGQSPPANPQDPEWVRWRADRISRDFARMFRAIKNTKEDCIVALSPNPQPFAIENFLQDWITWEREGWLEELILQVYRPDMERFNMELNRPSIQAVRRHIPVGIGIMTGLKNYPVPMELIWQQVQAARQAGYRGVSFFFYETLWTGSEGRDTRKRLFRSMFATPAKHPNLNDGWTIPF